MPACVDNRNSVTRQELYNYLVAGDISRGRAECVIGVPPQHYTLDLGHAAQLQLREEVTSCPLTQLYYAFCSSITLLPSLPQVSLCSVKLLAPTRLFTMRREENKTLLPIANNVQLLVCEIITEIAPWIEDKKTAVCGHVTSSEVCFCSVVCAFSLFQVYLLDSSLCLLF